MTLADRIVVLRSGRIEQVGRPLEIFEKPANTFVAGFIGSPPMNMVPAHIIREGEKTFVQAGSDLRLPVPPHDGAVLPPDLPVVMGLRPEDVVSGKDRERFPAQWQVQGRVDVVEPLGSETLLHMDIHGFPLIAKSEGRQVVAPGQTIWIGLNLERLHLFDGATTRSIY
jgi:multiple sugar transport system ATP-binding protein